MNNSFETAAGGPGGAGKAIRPVRPNLPLPKVRVGLLWHSASSGNLGVGALTVANMAILRGVAEELGLELDFTVIGMRDGETSYVDATDARVFAVDTASLFRPDGCWAVMGAQDCLVDIGAGDSFADIYGPKRFFFLWWTKMVAIMRRRPLLLSPQTIGPFTRPGYKGLARLALEKSRTVVARDDQSLRALHELAPRAHGVLSVDVAFALPYQDRSGERGGKRLRVGVNVSGLLFTEAETGRNHFGLSIDYARVMRRFISDLCDQGAEVHLVSHVVPSAFAADDDGLIAQRLHAEFPATKVVPTFASPSEAKSFISSLDFLVAGRMHACIAAFSSGVPVAPVAYSRKFSGLFGMLDYAWLVPVSGLDDDHALEFLHNCLANRATLAADEARGMSKVSALLDVYKRELADLFSSLAVG
jgi:polysaccharide pyruvyl transferase WcaK-like protein